MDGSKEMEKMKTIIQGALKRDPTVMLTEEVIASMTQEVLDRPNIETAWGLAGFIFGEGETVIATNVLRPDPAEITRQYARTSLGGNIQAQALQWLMANAELIRKHNGIVNDARYGFLFKGHSHHQLGYSEFSAPDHASMVESISQDGMSVSIGPLANIKKHNYSASTSRFGTPYLKVSIEQEVEFRIYYLNKKMVQSGQPAIVVLPTIINATQVFMPIPELGWQFTNRPEFLEQLRHLKAIGCEVSLVTRDAIAGPPLEQQFAVTHPAWRGILSIITAADYPKTPPKFEVLDPKGYSRVAYKWVHCPDKLTGELWLPGEDLFEAIYRLEARGEL